MKPEYLLIIILILLLNTAGAAADISWEQIDISSVSGEKTTFRQTIFISNDKFAIETADGMRMILNISDNTVTTLDLTEKTYYKVSLKKLEEMQKNIQLETDKMIEDALKNMTEEQRRIYKQRLEQKIEKTENKTARKEPSWEEFKPTGKTEKILGYTAAQYSAEGGDGTVYEIWCTEEINTSEPKDFFRNMEKTQLLSDKGPNYSALMPGFPLKSTQKQGDNIKENKVISIQFDPVPGSVFTVPDDFTLSEPAVR